MENITCINNTNISTSLDGSFLLFSNISMVSLSHVTFFSNQFQFLQSIKSSLKLSYLEIKSHLINELMSLQLSFVSVEYSNFTNDIELDLCQSTPCQMKTLALSDCNLSLTNISFISRQTNNFSIAQYKIYITNRQTGESVILKNAVFDNPSFYAQNLFSLTVDSCQFELSESFVSNGGLMLENTIEAAANLIFSNSKFVSLKSAISLNFISLDHISMISIISCNFSQNQAAFGGAISIIGITKIIIEQSNFTMNKATSLFNQVFSGLGGVIYSKCWILDRCEILLNGSNFLNNEANLGGGIFLENYGITASSNMTFDQNYAKVLNDSNNSNMSSPSFLHMTYFRQANQKPLYFDFSNQTDRILVNNFKTFEMKFNITDVNNNQCPYLNYPAHSSLTFLNSTINSKPIDSFAINGTIYFFGMLFNGNRNSSYYANITLENSFQINKTLEFYVRECQKGEYLANNLTCEWCPLGTYSLTFPDMLENNKFPQQDFSVCQICVPNSQCQGFTICPNPNYWINTSELTINVIKCPSPGACLYEDLDSFQKPVKCNYGYIGDLCVTCQKNFSKDGYQSKCLACEWKASEVLIYIVKFLYMLIFVSININSVLFGKFKKDEQLGTIIKITRDHFNQIFLIYGF